jgi:hypothetical protein
MTPSTGLRATEGIYYLALGVWLGAIVMLAIAAAVTFKTMRAYDPILQTAPYSAPQLQDRAAPILAGAIVGNSLRVLAVLQVSCAVVIGLCVLAQCAIFAEYLRGGVAGRANLLRLALVILPMALLAVELTVISPRIWQQREIMYDPGESEAAREQALTTFRRHHLLSEQIMGAAGLALAGAILVSPFALRHSDLVRSSDGDRGHNVDG